VEKEVYTELCIEKVRRGIVWWKIGAWRLKIVGIWDERLKNGDVEIDVRMLVGCKSKEHWQKIRIHMAKLKINM
jgi:hypothetical protein